MKVFNVIWKILLAVAAVAGIVYVFITYGDKISAWFKKLIGGCCCCCGDDCDCDCQEETASEKDFEE